jgi:ATP-dependent Clp protease ATP-binding subunit ClpX
VDKLLAVTGASVSRPIAGIRRLGDEPRTERCSFCGKRRHQVSAMAHAGGARICDECLRMCLEIRREHLN